MLLFCFAFSFAELLAKLLLGGLVIISILGACCFCSFATPPSDDFLWDSFNIFVHLLPRCQSYSNSLTEPYQ